MRHSLDVLGPDGVQRRVVLLEGEKLSQITGRSCEDRRCGYCVFEVLEGSPVSALKPDERLALERDESGLCRPGRRLACHASVAGPGRVRVPFAWSLAEVHE